MKYHYVAFLFACPVVSALEEETRKKYDNLRRRLVVPEKEEGPFDKEEVGPDEHGSHRKLGAIHMFVESNFLVRNDFGLTTTNLVGGFSPEDNGILDAFTKIGADVVDSLSYVKYIPDQDSIVSFVDTFCTTNCGTISSRSRCQRLTTTFEIGVHPYHPMATTAREEVEQRLEDAITRGQLRSNLQQYSTLIYNIQDSTQCSPVEEFPSNPIRRPPGEETGHQQATDSDLGIRFNKMPMISRRTESSMPDDFFPMTSTDYYPMSLTDAEVIRNSTRAVSVFHPDDCPECTISPQELIEASKVTITHPSSDPNSPFWDELWEVILVQLHRIDSHPVEELMELPDIWYEFNIHQVAEAVHDEFPGLHHTNHLQKLFGPGGLDKQYERNCRNCANIDRNIIPSQSATEFIRGAVLLGDLLSWAIGVVGPLNFSAKWFVGRARPEEVVWEIYNDRLNESHGVPEYIVQTVQQRFHLDQKENFTAYPEGSPDHPSWPAMHAAASAASLWMPLVLDLTEEQHCQVKALDYGIAYARTIAGVHYFTDSIGGLNIAQEILSRKLPEYLAEKYGSDPAVVSAKINELRFDWNDYLTSECMN